MPPHLSALTEIDWGYLFELALLPGERTSYHRHLIVILKQLRSAIYRLHLSALAAGRTRKGLQAVLLLNSLGLEWVANPSSQRQVGSAIQAGLCSLLEEIDATLLDLIEQELPDFAPYAPPGPILVLSIAPNAPN